MSQLRDFYIRPATDPAHRADQFEVYNELESTMQQIKMTLFTQRGEVLGEPQFGLEVEKYLFSFDVDPFSLTRDASSQINLYVLEGKKRNITVRAASYADDRVGREIMVLLIDIPELKNPLSIFYD